MRVGVVALVVVWALGCGDDDVGGLGDSGFSSRDAASDAGCELPFYLSAHDRNLDAGIDDAGHGLDAGNVTLACEFRPGTIDNECENIDWHFAGGEHILLPGCCTATGECGVLDPTNALGCIPRDVFGEAPTSCNFDPTMDAGDDDASAR